MPYYLNHLIYAFIFQILAYDLHQLNHKFSFRLNLLKCSENMRKTSLVSHALAAATEVNDINFQSALYQFMLPSNYII